MLGLSLIYYTYAMVMWYIFFKVPTKFGQVSRFNVEKLGEVGHDSILIYENGEENLKTVMRELEHDR